MLEDDGAARGHWLNISGLFSVSIRHLFDRRHRLWAAEVHWVIIFTLRMLAACISWQWKIGVRTMSAYDRGQFFRSG